MTIPAFGRSCLLAVIVPFAATGTLSARTITLTADDCDQLAVISAAEPRLSWAPAQMGPGVYDTWQNLHLFPDMAILMRFPIEKIPTGQRVTKAEFSFVANYLGGAKQVSVRRLVTQWGTGVCHDYRLAYPKKLAWAKPGARGVTSDRANKASAVFNIEKLGEQTADVTETVELWYTGAVRNYGWVMSIDDAGAVYMPSLYPSGSTWKLQITYEPQ